MHAALDHGPPRDAGDLDAFGRIACEAFAIAPERIGVYFDSVGRENVRVARCGDVVVAGLVSIPKGQFFGGRSIPMAGLALVCTAAHARGGGVATELLRSTLREQRAAGRAISALYPASVRLYRRAGYEIAGATCEVSLPLDGIDVRERSARVLPADDAHTPAIEAVYRRFAERTAGAIDRTAFHWGRVRSFRGDAARAYVVIESAAGVDEVTGYVFVRDVKSEGLWWCDAYVQDMAADTPPAARAILNFLAGLRTTRRKMEFRSGPTDPFLMLLGEEVYEIKHQTPWMLRMLDVAAALRGRGYPAGLCTRLRLSVADDFLPEVGGEFDVVVSDGAARVTAAGDVPGGGASAVTTLPHLTVDERGLASMFTGYLSPWNARMLGLAAGDDAALDAAAAMFAGPVPWNRDPF